MTKRTTKKSKPKQPAAGQVADDLTATTPAAEEAVVPDTSAASDAPSAPPVPEQEQSTVTTPVPETAEQTDHAVITAGASVAAEPIELMTSVPRRRSRAPYLLVAAVLLIVAGAGLYVLRHRSADDSAAVRSLVAEVANRAVLPGGETPTVTTVVDARKANQAFLAGAQNGDKVLLYFRAGRAILYRPSTQQVVNMGPLTQPPAQVFLRDGAAGDIPAALRSKITAQSSLTIVSQDVSPRRSYDHTLVIDLNGNRPDLAAQVAKLVGGTVASLPNGESRPVADILVIRGADQ